MTGSQSITRHVVPTKEEMLKQTHVHKWGLAVPGCVEGSEEEKRTLKEEEEFAMERRRTGHSRKRENHVGVWIGEPWGWECGGVWGD